MAQLMPIASQIANVPSTPGKFKWWHSIHRLRYHSSLPKLALWSLLFLPLVFFFLLSPPSLPFLAAESSLRRWEVPVSYGFGNYRHHVKDSQGFDQVPPNKPMGVFSQRDWDLFLLWKWYKELEDESEKKAAVLTVITERMRRQILVDGNIEMIAVLLFGPEEAASMLSSLRKPGIAVIDDWSCYNSLIDMMYETHCGSVMEAGLKYLYAFENLCHNGVSKAVMKQACEAVCAGHNLNKVKDRISDHNTYDAGSLMDVNQRDADLLFLWQRYKKSEDGSEIKAKILRQIIETMRYQIHLDGSIEMIGALLFGPLKGPSILSSLRKPGLAVVDDWRCLKSMVRVFETHCGLLTPYGMKHMRAFANLCNNGVSEAAMKHACDAVCAGHKLGSYHLSKLGYSA